MKRPAAEKVHTLIDQQLALGAYLEALLSPSPPALSEEVQTPAAPEPASPVLAREARSDPAAQVPAWAERPFQCLLFKVAGLSLAVPLIKLHGVLSWPQPLTGMPGHAPWFLGLMRHQGANSQVVDAAQWVLPQERRAKVPPVEERARNLILIDEARWALACDGVSEVITLDPTGVRWRTSRSKRPWLAGTVIQHMCALLDTDAFARMLTTGER